MSDATFASPDLTMFAGLDGLGLEVTGQCLEPGRAVLACRVLEPDDWCRECGCAGRYRDSMVRRLAHEPFGWRPTVLHVTVRRYACTGCSRLWCQDTAAAAAEPRAPRVPSAAPPWASTTSPATSPEVCSRPAASDPDYTVKGDEPGDLRLPAERWRALARKVGRELGRGVQTLESGGSVWAVPRD